MRNEPSRVPIRFDRAYAALSTVLFLSPSDSYVELTGGDVHVRMAWAFRATFPRASVVRAFSPSAHPISRGVHGLAGKWLVNGAGDRLVTIVLAPEPAQRARVLGFPVRLRELTVSVDDPDALVARLRGEPARPASAARG